MGDVGPNIIEQKLNQSRVVLYSKLKDQEKMDVVEVETIPWYYKMLVPGGKNEDNCSVALEHMEREVAATVLGDRGRGVRLS